MTITHIKKTNGLFPLTSTQKRIWFMENFDGNTTAYDLPLDFKITGDLKLDILERGIDMLIERHESLRTIFANMDGSPVQKVLPEVRSNLKVVHLENESQESQHKAISQHSLTNASFKFDLEKGPLFRFEVLVLGRYQFYFLMNFHHIIFDDESVRIFLDELIAVMESLSTGKPVNLSPVAVSFEEYAIAQNKWIESEDCRSQLDYWKKELAGTPEALNLPIDFHRPKILTYNGTEYNFIIGQELREKLFGLSTKNSASISIPLLTAFGALLSRYSSQDDFVVGVPVSNRNYTELQTLVGVLINTLPIRFQFEEGMTFLSCMEQTREKFFAAYENQEVPFEHLLQELDIRRATDISPVYQVLFNFLPGEGKALRLGGTILQKVEGERRSAQLDFSLTVIDRKKDLFCTIEYNTDLFLKETAERFAGHYATMLEEVCRDDGQLIGEIPILTEKEKAMMLVEWNQTRADYQKDHCVHQVFEEQVQRTPDAVAVEFGKTRLTYAELNARANQLASHLLKHGAGEDRIIAIFLERNLDLPVALLAIAKTGATYLPLDPIYPKRRLELIIEDADPVIVLTQSSLLGKMPETMADIILMDDAGIFNQGPAGNPGLGNPEKPVYILYTSGSTGKPKGVPIRHHSVVNLINYTGKFMTMSPSDIVLAITTISFDIAELEIYTPLFTGARVVIASQETTMNPELLMQAIDDYKVTMLQATPVTYKMLVRASWAGKPDLRVICGGEALSRELAADLLARCEAVWNCYGPTETTIWSVCKKVTPADLQGDGYVAIGRPAENTVLYVLNKKKVPVPVGLPGELYIGGEGVSPGYLHLPEKTAQQFVPDLFGLTPGQKLYKTGDLVRYQPDGNLVFLDRADSQVKIRGFRIELGEIESALSRIEGMKENVVVVREDSTGEKMLAAYYVMKDGVQTDPLSIRRFLSDFLPEYMVPSTYTRMEKFPLTENNKVDRKALPVPENDFTPAETVSADPETPTEKKLASIWKSILKLDKVGINDNFFEIGGHSMIAVSMILKIESELGIRLPLATLFERTTIQSLAELIDASSVHTGWRSLVAIRPGGTKKPLFLVHGLGLNVLLYSALVNHLDPDLPVYGLQAKGLDGREKPLETLESIASHYISEIMTVDPEGPYAIGGFSLGGRIAYEMAQQLHAMGKKVSFLGLFDTSADESYGQMRFLKKNKARIKFFFEYIKWNISYLFNNPLESRSSVIIRRWNGLKKKLYGLDIKIEKKELVSKGSKHELPRYMRKVHRANKKADKSYRIKPYPGMVVLFKASHQTFYQIDPENYGWDKLAQGGMVIREIPGEHSRIFAPPNDKLFAHILEDSLNISD